MLDDDTLVRLRAKLAKVLAGFSADVPADFNPYALSASRPDRAIFPVPELVLFALRDIMAFRWEGVGEKVRWSVYCTVDGEPVSFELRKFGFTIGMPETCPLTFRRRVEGQLASALHKLEPALDSLAKDQVDRGNLTIENRFSEFDRRYRYFRELADCAFAASNTLPPSGGRDGNADVGSPVMATLNAKIRNEQEGFFASAAMVDAYFSRLEHRVLLLRAFVGIPLETGAFRAFLAKKWDERLCEIVDFSAGHAAGQLLGRLRNVKERIRNPLAHGNVENDGGAFHFHMPQIGAIPANLSRHRGSIRFSFLPVPAETHEETCVLFDSFDRMLSEGLLALPDRFVDAGIDPQYDASSIAEYADALQAGPKSVGDLIDHLGEAWSRHANMDY